MLIYGVGALSALLCFCALLLDVSLFEQTKVRAQNAADAAAIGAVFDYQDGGSYTRGGTADATLNGFTAGGGTTVTISNPPTTGAYTGNTYAVQTTVTTTAKGTFLPGTKTITARATAMGIGPTPCVYMLSKAFPAQPSMYIGNQTNQYNCATYLGSSFNVSGGSSSGSQFFVAANSSNSSGSPSPAAIFGAPTLADPLAYITPPSIGSCASVSGTTLNPGTYCGGIQLSGSGSYTLNPGVYISQGPLIINGPNLTGTGVTIYVTAGSGSSMASSIQNINATLSAPTSGSLQGILVYFDRSLPAGQATLTLANWNPGTLLDGIFYLPNQELIASNVPLKCKKYLGIVADYSHISNTGFVPAADYSTLANGNPFHPVGGGGGIVE